METRLPRSSMLRPIPPIIVNEFERMSSADESKVMLIMFGAFPVMRQFSAFTDESDAYRFVAIESD